MKLLIKQDELKNYKSRDKIPLECEICHTEFYTTKNNVLRVFKSRPNDFRFCSRICNNKRQSKSQNVICKNCQIPFVKMLKEIKKFNNHFCSKSCSAIYNNTHKTTGYRRSKLEIWLEERLTKLYPLLEIHFNKVNTINAELDIYIPSLKLAVELNGIFHYEPIYSDDKLKRTKNNDERKFQACLEKKIELCVIDTSTQKYFKEKTSEKFLNIITEIINKKLAEN